jgi:hypothetical protein
MMSGLLRLSPLLLLGLPVAPQRSDESTGIGRRGGPGGAAAASLRQRAEVAVAAGDDLTACANARRCRLLAGVHRGALTSLRGELVGDAGAVMSGADPVPNRWAAAGGGLPPHVYKQTLRLPAGAKVEQLYAGGRWLPEARWPNLAPGAASPLAMHTAPGVPHRMAPPGWHAVPAMSNLRGGSN